MRRAINRERRRFVGAGAMTLAATQLAVMPFADAQTVSKKESPPQPEKSGMNTSFTSLKQVNAGLLSVGYAEAGPAEGPDSQGDARRFRLGSPHREHRCGALARTL